MHALSRAKRRPSASAQPRLQEETTPLTQPLQSSPALRVLMVGSEVYPLLKTGGLADVLGALPPALALLGMDCRLLLPGYPALCAGLENQRRLASFNSPWGRDIGLLAGTLPDSGITTYLIEHPGLYDRPGNPYQDSSGQDWQDNLERFALLGWVGAHFDQLQSEFHPDIIHGHDWHAGLAPAWLHQRQGARPASIHTIHNLAYPGDFPAWRFGGTHLPEHYMQTEGIEFYGRLSLLKAGLYFADWISTVSPTYATEILEPEGGMGFEGLLRHRQAQLCGIINGVDYEVWNPETDSDLSACFSATDLSGKARVKRDLQTEYGLQRCADSLVYGVVSRLAHQKGLDILLESLPAMMASPHSQLVLLGAGDSALEAAFRDAAAQWPGRVGVSFGFSEARAHHVIGGADVLLMPSRHEPCGLTQLYAMRYGTLPLVNAVGGLADTVTNCTAENRRLQRATGFHLPALTLEALTESYPKVSQLWRQRDAWEDMMRQGMQTDFSWHGVARRYEALYRRAVVQRHIRAC
jgi:starch synthase